MALYTAGTAFLQVVPSMRGFHNEVRSQLRGMRLDAEVELRPKVNRGAFEAEARKAKPSDQTVTIKADIDRKSFADATNRVALFAKNLGSMAVLPAAGIAATPMLMGVAAAATQATTSLLLLPAAGTAYAATMGTVKVATMGVGDALKHVMDADPEKFNKALAETAPAARSTLVELRSLRPELMGLRDLVAARFFAGFAGEIDALGKTYFPVLRTGMGGVAGELNGMALGIGAFAREAQTVRDVEGIFKATATSVDLLTPGMTAVVQLIRDIAAEGSHFLPGLANGFTMAAQSARDFIAEARQSGDLARWISDGMNTLGNLVKTIINLGAIVAEVFGLAKVEGRGFSEVMVEVTGGWLEWVRSAEGGKIIADVFRTIWDLANALGPMFGAIAVSLIGAVTTIAPNLPPLIKGVTDVFAASGPLIDIFGELTFLILPPLGAALSALAPILGPLVFIYLNAAAAAKVYSIAVTALGLAQKIGAGFQAAYLLATNGFKIAAAAAAAGTKGWAVAQGLLNVAMRLNPIGLVITLITTFVALLVFAWHNSETFRNVVIGAWEGIKAAASAFWSWAQEMFASFMGALREVGDFFTWLWREAVVPAWEGIKSAASVAWDILKAVFEGISLAARVMFAVVATIVLTPLILLWNEVSGLFKYGYENLIKPAWEGITGAISAAWAAIEPIFSFIVEWVSDKLTSGTNRFRDVCRQAWENIKEGIRIAWEFIRTNIWQPILDFIDQWLKPGFLILRDVAIAAWNNLRDGIRIVWEFIRNNIWQPILDFINQWLVPGFNILRDGAIAAWNNLRDGIRIVWEFIRDNIWQPLVDFITVTIPEKFRAGVDLVGRAWDMIKEKLRAPVKAAIDVVWNNGVVKAWNFVAKLVNLSPLEPVNIAGFATGGPIRGGTPGKDSVIIKAMPGEYMFSKPAVDALGGTNVVDALHRMWRDGGAPNRKRDQFLPGYAAGGPIGGARAQGSASVTTASGSVQAASPLALAVDWMKDLVGGIANLASAVGSGFGDWGAGMIGMGKKLGTAALDFLKGKVAEYLASFAGVAGGAGGGGIVAGQVGSMMAVLRAAFPGLALISGFRPGAITATGNRSYHSMGRAVDLPPSMAVFNWIRANYGANTKELIFSPAGGAQIHNGRPHVYTGITRAMHFDHVHWAMDRGGLGRGTGIMMKDVIAPERVLSPRQTESFDRLVSHLTGSRTRTLRDPGVDAPLGSATAGGPYIGQVVVPVPEGASVDQTIDAIMTRARHEGKRGGRYGRP